MSPGLGWQTLPLGCGGLITGFQVGPDGTMICRSDVGNAYRWSGTTASVTDPSQKWIPLLTYASLGSSAVLNNTSVGMYELVMAPSLTSNLYAIFGDDANVFRWFLYYSTNSGATWTKAVGMFNNNADSNGNNRRASGKIAVDPAQPNVVYCGMPPLSGQADGCYRAIDGVTFTALGKGQTTLNPGSCGITFDPSQGTTVVSGQTRTARVIVPIGGVGIFESLDGGVTFTETAVTAMGSSSIAVYQAAMDFSGVYYAIVSTNGGNGFLWRYSGPAGTWVQLDAQAGWFLGAGWVGQGVLLADPRNGHQGFLSVAGPQGFGNGATSHNANAAAASVTWTGRTGGSSAVLVSPSYDVPWLGHAITAFLDVAATQIDSNGTCWYCGNQGFWFTSAIPDYPNFGPAFTLTSNSVSRGMEATVSQDICCPAGAPNPVMGAQDVGIMVGTLTSYPTNYYPSGGRADCEFLEWASSDPSFMVARVSIELTAPVAGALSAYSTNFGALGSWTPYSTQADSMYVGTCHGYISNGSGASGTVFVVTAVNTGNVLIGQAIDIAGTSKGTIIGQSAGPLGGAGTYTLDTASLTGSVGSPSSFNCVIATNAGAVAIVDHDHHVVVPSGFDGAFVPVCTANATGACTWSFCNGLPQSRWTNRSFVNGVTPRPFAADRVNIGTVYAAQIPSGAGTTCAIYKSTDSGANFAQVSTITSFGAGGNLVGLYLFATPGNAGHLWLTAYFTSGGGANLWRSTNGGTTWTTVTLPGGGIPVFLTLGVGPTPGSYPTIFVYTYGGAFAATIYYSTDQGTTWNIFGPTGTQHDLPPSCQLSGLQNIQGDWNVFKKLYASSGQNGFAFFDPGTPDLPLPPFGLRAGVCVDW